MTGTELRAIRKKMSKTQAQFAAFLGVSQEMVSMMEGDEKAVPSEIASKLGHGGMFKKEKK